MTRLLALRNHVGTIRLMALQFLSLAGIGVAWPYVNVYLTDIGFSGTVIGTLGSGGAVLSLVLTPLLNQIADRRNSHRRLFMLYLGGFAIANVIFATSNIPALIVAAVLLFRITTSPSLTLGMQLTITQLIRSGKAILGQIRSFASLGFAAASLLAGQLFALGGYPLLFWVGAAFALASIQLATVFPAKPLQKHSADDAKRQPRNRGFFVLAASQFFISMGTYNAYAFMFIHFNQNLGVASADIGLWAAILGGVEVPFTYLMDAILPRFRIRSAYIVSVLGIAVFTLALGFAPNLPALALLLVFRGLTWPGFYLSSFTLVNAISHPGNVATNQALLQVTMPSIALVLTGSLFGWIFDNLGAGAFFAICALMCLIGVGIVIAGFRLFEPKN
ncbi:MAG: MFS transporter [Chloroflexi bacterium]|nr:MFS transporter [Chloroflexota bacterium]